MTPQRQVDSLDVGLLIIRLGVGAIFAAVHGWPKISGGPQMWDQVGAAMGFLGIDFAHRFWGFMAAMSEFVGGLLFAIGLFFRPAAFLLLSVMIVATALHIGLGDPVGVVSNPLKLAFVFLGLMIAGPGRYSLWAAIPSLRKSILG